MCMAEKSKITVYVSPETTTKIKALLAIHGNVSMGDVIDTAITDYIGSQPAAVRRHVDDAVKLAQSQKKD